MLFKTMISCVYLFLEGCLGGVGGAGKVEPVVPFGKIARRMRVTRAVAVCQGVGGGESSGNTPVGVIGVIDRIRVIFYYFLFWGPSW